MAKQPINFSQNFLTFIRENFNISKRPFKQIISAPENWDYVMAKWSIQDFLDSAYDSKSGTKKPAREFGEKSYIMLCEALTEKGIPVKKFSFGRQYSQVKQWLKIPHVPLGKYTAVRRKARLKNLLRELKTKGQGFVKDEVRFNQLLKEAGQLVK